MKKILFYMTFSALVFGMHVHAADAKFRFIAGNIYGSDGTSPFSGKVEVCSGDGTVVTSLDSVTGGSFVTDPVACAAADPGKTNEFYLVCYDTANNKKVQSDVCCAYPVREVPSDYSLVGFGDMSVLTTNSSKWVSASVAVTGVTLDSTEATIRVGGESLTLTATVVPENATDKTVTWSTSDATKATVSSDGVVTAVAPGTVTITATASGKFATCTVTVLPPLKTRTISLNKWFTLVSPGYVKNKNGKQLTIGDIVPVGDDAVNNVFLQTRDNYGATVGNYAWMFGGDDNDVKGWYDLDPNNQFDSVDSVDIALNPGQAFLVQSCKEGLELQITGEELTSEVQVQLRAGQTDVGNPYDCAIDLQSIRVEGEDVGICKLSKDGEQDKVYYWYYDDEGPEYGWVDTDDNDGDMTFQPGEGFIVFGPDSEQYIRFMRGGGGGGDDDDIEDGDDKGDYEAE